MKNFIFGLIVLMSLLTSCEDDRVVIPEAGALVADGGFTFQIDGTADYVSGITMSGTVVGDFTTFIITDESDIILGLPATMAELESVDFDGAGTGNCYIWYLAADSDTDVSGLTLGEGADTLTGIYDISNSIQVTRE